MTVDIRLRVWRLVFKSKEPPPHWQRKRRGAKELCKILLARKGKHSTQSLSMHER